MDSRILLSVSKGRPDNVVGGNQIVCGFLRRCQSLWGLLEIAPGSLGCPNLISDSSKVARPVAALWKCARPWTSDQADGPLDLSIQVPKFWLNLEGCSTVKTEPHWVKNLPGDLVIWQSGESFYWILPFFFGNGSKGGVGVDYLDLMDWVIDQTFDYLDWFG